METREPVKTMTDQDLHTEEFELKTAIASTHPRPAKIHLQRYAEVAREIIRRQSEQLHPVLTLGGLIRSHYHGVADFLIAFRSRYGWAPATPTVSVWINGRAIPHPSTRQQIAELLGVKSEQLWPEK